MRIIHLPLILLFIGCAVTNSNITILPPKVQTDIKKVAVIDIANDSNEYFATTLASVLAKATNNGNEVFKIINRQGLDKILTEHHFQMVLGEEEQRQLSFEGIQGGFTGSISKNNSETVMIAEKIGAKTLHCNSTDHHINVAIRLIDFATTKEVYSRTINKGLRYKTCAGQQGFIIEEITLEKQPGKYPDSVENLSYSADPQIILMNRVLLEIAQDFSDHYEVKSTLPFLPELPK